MWRASICRFAGVKSGCKKGRNCCAVETKITPKICAELLTIVRIY